MEYNKETGRAHSSTATNTNIFVKGGVIDVSTYGFISHWGYLPFGYDQSIVSQ